MDGLTRYEWDEILGTPLMQDLDDDKPISNPVGDWFARAELRELDKATGVADVAWDEPMTARTFPAALGTLEKRSSGRGRIRLVKRLVDDEVWIEGFDSEGECVSTRVIPADQVFDGEPFAKSEVSS